jgi:hypothetical protein
VVIKIRAACGSRGDATLTAVANKIIEHIP